MKRTEILLALDRLIVRRAARALLPARWRAPLQGLWGWMLAPGRIDLGGTYLYRLPGVEGGRWLTIARGEYEPETTRLLRHLLKPGAHFVDVGAHIGYYTLLAAAVVGPRGRVWAFEPAPDTYRLLLEEVRRNGLTNVQAERLAVGSASKEAPFFLHPARGKSSLYQGAGTGEPIIVPMTSLDAYFRVRGHPRVDVVKMDIEGGEVEALVGMRETVARNPHLRLVVEFNPRALRAAGHSPVDFLDALYHANLGRVRTIEASPRALRIPQQVIALAEELLQSREKKVVNLLCEGPEADAL